MSPERDQHASSPGGNSPSSEEDTDRASARVFNIVSIAEVGDSKLLGSALAHLQGADVLVCTIVLTGTLMIDTGVTAITVHPGQGILQVGALTTLGQTDPLRVISVAVDADLVPVLGPRNDISAATLERSELLVAFTRFTSGLLGHDPADKPSTPVESRCLERTIVQLIRGLAETAYTAPLPRSTKLASLHRAALALVASRYMDPALNSVEMARALGVSRRLLFLAFAQHDESYADALRRARVEAVKAELRLNPDEPLQVLLSDSGFGSHETLKRSFRASERVTIATYRRRLLCEQNHSDRGDPADA